MVGDDALAQLFERQACRQRGQPVVPLAESSQQLRVALWQRLRGPALEPGEERPLGRRAAQKDERIVRHADERRSEHADERFVVVAVVQQPQVVEEIDDLLLSEVALAGRPVGRDAELPQLLLVPLRVGAGGEEEDDLPRGRCAGVEQLTDSPRDCLRLRAPPVDPVVVRVRGLVRDE